MEIKDFIKKQMKNGMSLYEISDAFVEAAEAIEAEEKEAFWKKGAEGIKQQLERISKNEGTMEDASDVLITVMYQQVPELRDSLDEDMVNTFKRELVSIKEMAKIFSEILK